MFVGYVENLFSLEGATCLQGINLQSMTINENVKQVFPFKTFKISMGSINTNKE
jgi:hypothetical protein